MLALPAVLTQHEAGDVLRLFREAQLQNAGAAEMQVDASALERFDSCALAVLLACKREAQAAKKRFVLQGMPAKLLELATLYGVDALLEARPATA